MKDKEKKLIAVIEKVLRDTQNCDMSIETLTDYLVDRIKDKVFPEDSVVLSMEELEKIINQTKETEKNYYKKVVIPQERKETADKNISDIFRICKQRFNDTKGYTCWGDIEIAIQQYAEQFGVEIKENKNV